MFFGTLEAMCLFGNREDLSDFGYKKVLVPLGYWLRRILGLHPEMVDTLSHAADCLEVNVCHSGEQEMQNHDEAEDPYS